MQDFLTWMEDTQEEPVLNEYGGFLDALQNPGDLVFFGIHLLNRQYNELGKFPFVSLGGSDPDRIDISRHVTEIVESDPVRRTVIVKPDRTPYAMGYRNKHLNTKNRRGQFHIPSKQLEDVTFLLPKESQSKTLWLVINNSYQKNLAASLRRRELAARQAQENPAVATDEMMPGTL